jgi:hypothetical protein
MHRCKASEKASKRLTLAGRPEGVQGQRKTGSAVALGNYEAGPERDALKLVST